MKMRLNLFFPFFFAAATLIIYVLLYSPFTGVNNFVNGSVVFLAALGWSAIILHTEGEKHPSNYVYISISILAPFIILFFLKEEFTLRHIEIIGLHFILLLCLFVYIRTSFCKSAQK